MMPYQGFIVDLWYWQPLSVTLARSALVSGKSFRESALITSNPACMAYLFISSFIKYRGGWGMRLIDTYKTDYLVHQIIKIHLC